jgi:hypothetical protein
VLVFPGLDLKYIQMITKMNVTVGLDVPPWELCLAILTADSNVC